MEDSLDAFAVDRWCLDYCGSLCTTRVNNEASLESGSFGFDTEYFSHHATMIIIAWRLLLAYIEITVKDPTSTSNLQKRDHSVAVHLN
ncbi:hypothetical protein TNCV_934581 [Trichonephila clavipes]|nr:hypothetical protein TNCV_934581 [Trichonephila clavipes]